ncbi:helix-turn-helix transcriptional regulator [Nodosilinea sp. LEGE 07088]|uniref:AraC family transcriptional regulator n=1 Tax=Nodosilinea sp. LEGE 07088 TaxID=2777968 RepID=UPI00187F9C76|nr:AraC family transcriptional regulator [Nodosilinea sp. LEGE 07088]MBE9138668.1 helix-turn-helix transcriptional regulator [Nodosilinea sp. LEGE 07088]
MAPGAPENTPIQIVPRSPGLRSRNSIADLLRVEIHHQPGEGVSECRLPHYQVSVHLGPSIWLQQTTEGQHRSGYQAEGDIMVTPPNLHRQLAWDVDAQFLLLRLEPKLFHQAALEWADVGQLEITPQPNLKDPLIQQIGLALKAETERNGLSNRLYAEAMGNALAVHLLHHYSHQPLDIKSSADGLADRKLGQSIDYIQAHLSDDLSVEAVAAHIGMSRYYFSRQFQQSVGISPYQYVLQQRVEKAKSLLHREDLTITDIALECGFIDSSHLARQFRKVVGVPPSVYRQQVR